jgi:hypothetical protein
MLEVKQIASYLFGLVMVAAILSAGAAYAVLEGVEYVSFESDVSAVKKGMELAQGEHSAERREGPPVWVSPTPKYDYDPKLMIVKPREERLKEVELKRKLEAAKHLAKQQADKKAQQRVAQHRRERQLREEAGAYAYQPEERFSFGIFSLSR